MLNLLKKNKAYLIAAFLMIFYPMILLLVVIMLLDPSEKAFALDKLTHFGTFSILSYIIYFALSYQDKVWFLKKHRTIITILFALLIGASIEIIQLYIPTRSTNVFDEVANLCGIFFALLIIKYLPKRIKNLKRYGI
jgi:VanZ family protein